MADPFFLDTNVLVYAFDNAEPVKQALARELLAGGGTFVLSAQVLGEFFVTVTRKLAEPLSIDRAREAIAALEAVPIEPITAPLVTAAIGRVQRSQLSYWDALIVETCRAADCTILLTEDLQDGQLIDGVRVRDPFARTDVPQGLRP